jgi:hypothetical protein
MAPAKVLHGAVRLHGLTSSPTPDTQVRVACALAWVAEKAKKAANIRPNWEEIVLIVLPLVAIWFIFAHTRTNF